MVRPSRRGRMRALLTSEESTGVADGSNVDWDEGGIFDPVTGALDQWKQPVRVASTATVTISTALNAGDTIDGVTLAAGDRVLLKDQSTASQNGIYVAGTTPSRAADFDDDAEVLGALVYVIAGSTNTATAWKVTNTTAVTVGSTSIVWAAFGTGGSASFATPAIVLGSSAAAGAASTVIRSDATIAAFDATSPTTQALGDTAVVGTAAFAARRDHKHAMPTAAVTTSGLTQATARLLGRTTASTGAIEEITVGTGLSLSAGSLTATGSGGVTSIAKSGSAALTGAVTLTGGTNVTLTQVGNDISIAAASGGGGSSTPASIPNVVQARTNGNAVTSITVTAAASGNRFVMVTNSTTGQVTAPTCTNTTWTQLVTFTSTASSYYAIWVGVVAGGSSGTAITMTKPGSFNTVAVLEVTDALTPTVGASSTANTAAITGTGADIRIFGRLASTTTGRFVALSYCLDNTGNVPTIFPGVPATGVFMSPGVTLVVGYVGGASVSFGTYSINSAGASLIAEIT